MSRQFKVGDPVMIIGGYDCPWNIGKCGTITEIAVDTGDDLSHRVDGDGLIPAPELSNHGHQWCAPHELMLLRGDPEPVEQQALELVHEH